MTEIPQEKFLFEKLCDFVIQDIFYSLSESDIKEILLYVLRFSDSLIANGDTEEISAEKHVMNMWHANNGDDYFLRRAVPSIIYPFLRDELGFTNQDIKGHENYFREASEKIADIFITGLGESTPGEIYDSFMEKVSVIKESAKIYLENVIKLDL